MEFTGIESDDPFARTLNQQMADVFNEKLREAFHAGYGLALSKPEVDAQRANAWDEGYIRGVVDNASDLEPADNPYRD